ncbi:hypothetical protein PENDEC_c007G02870 [Penicillium decumbens]|uniref:RanBD1 domain-containing protein n=1 Tax=Penicillium decumbens TaxID=69771 RepID=A0A1V6PEK1_PENDC|nr:hypothetical protein PENDEC_c007G02870 [Penicillium decumbens]
MGSPHSDDGGERPVRKQLSKASIQSTPQDSAKETISSRKRSFEESRDTAEDHHEDGQSRKKRSREGTPNEPEQKQAGSKHESAGPQEVSNPVSSLSGTVPLGLEDQRPLDRAQEFHGFDQTNVPRHDESRLTSALDEREKLFEQLLKDDKPPAKQTPTSTTTAVMPSDDHSIQVPKKKRSREQLDVNPPNESEAASESVQKPVQAEPDEKNSTDVKEPEKKRHRDSSQEHETKSDKGFAGSAFAKSSLAAFAGSDKSPFGSIGASSPSVFKPADSGLSSFASASGSSGFGALGSGFSGVGGGFSAAAKTGGLTSFASPSIPAAFGETKPATLDEFKPTTLGAEESKDKDESDKEEAENEDNSTFEAEKTDERFYEQTMETGEEDEITYFSSKAKLFNFLDGEWKERGIGTFKLNGRKSSTDPEKIFSRMIMRADGNMRVMLNSSLFRGMNYGDSKNECPTSKQILLAGVENGRTVPLLLRLPNVESAEKLWAEIGKCIKNLPGDDEKADKEN